MYENKKRHTAGAVIFALVCLFNPNIHLIDFLPDFIGYLILARVFLRASDAVPYFEEAKSSFEKLAYVSIAKIPGLLIIGFVRSGNPQDYDIYPLMATGFAIVELIFLIPAVTNTFKALSYLGQRSSFSALLPSEEENKADSLPSLTYIFSVSKCLLYLAPELFRMSNGAGVTENSGYYIYVLIIALMFGFVFGGAWLYNVIKYVRAIADEGMFFSAIDELAGEGSMEKYEKRLYLRSVRTAFMFFSLAAVVSFDLSFDTFNYINLLPEFIFGILFMIGLIRLCRLADISNRMFKAAIAISLSYITVSVAAYLLGIRFLDNFGYSVLASGRNEEAKDAFLAFEITSLAECILHIALSVLFFLILKKFTDKTLGEGSMKKRTAALASLSALSGIAHFTDIVQNGFTTLVTTDRIDNTDMVMPTSALPWFGVVLTAAVLIYVFYSFYYFSTVSQELS